MRFRAATKADAPVLAELLNYAGEGMPLYLWGKLAKAGEDPWKIGRARAARDEGSFSWRNATVIEYEDECAGCLIGYAIAEQPEPVDAGIPAMFAPLQELENIAHATWYINVVGVLPRWRNLGLGGRLIALAEDTAHKQRLRGCSLIVADENRGARRLYERNDFRERATRKIVKEDWQSESNNWLLLVKEF